MTPKMDINGTDPYFERAGLQDASDRIERLQTGA